MTEDEILQLNINQDFWEDFVQEAFEHIENIEANILTFEKSPDDMEIIHSMFRAFHTLKGLSGFVEHFLIQEIAHHTETLMDLCRKGEIQADKSIINAILESGDYIKQLCENIEIYKDAAYASTVCKHVNELERMVNFYTGKAGAEEPAAIEEPAVELVEPVAIEEPSIAVEPESIEEPLTEAPDATVPEAKEKKAKTTKKKSAKKSAPEPEETPQETSSKVPDGNDIPSNFSEEEKLKNLDDFMNLDLQSLGIEPEEEPVESEPTPASVAASAPSTSSATSMPTPAAAAPKKPEVAEKSFVIEKQPIKNEEYMKVANSKIDYLVEMIGELIINQSLIDDYVQNNYANDNMFITNMAALQRTTRELQDISMFLRMVSLKATFQKISRIARDTIQDLNKSVDFLVSGEMTEIDRAVADRLLDPLVHLIKNAISHGIEEDESMRTATKKMPRGRVELNAYNKRGKIYIEVKDDGKGIDVERVYQKAIEKGIIDPNREYSKEEIQEFILLPGFSTAQKVDNISGRGVGMDVVKTEIMKIGGKIDIKSDMGVGTTMTLEVPVNHAIMNGTIIDLNGQHFIIPTINVKEIILPEDDKWVRTNEQRTFLRVREHVVPIIQIGNFLGDDFKDKNYPLVVLLEVEGEYKVLPITNVVGRQEIVVKPTLEEFINLRYISGMSILGNGRVSLIFDVDFLFVME